MRTTRSGLALSKPPAGWRYDDVMPAGQLLEVLRRLGRDAIRLRVQVEAPTRQGWGEVVRVVGRKRWTVVPDYFEPWLPPEMDGVRQQLEKALARGSRRAARVRR